MFIWTISDILGIGAAIIVFAALAVVSFRKWLKEKKCNHDGGVNETSACDAICRKCGKNLGFIGTWREKHHSA